MTLKRYRVPLVLALLSGGFDEVTERTVDVMLAHIRPKLGEWASHIETARGIGYRFVR